MRRATRTGDRSTRRPALPLPDPDAARLADSIETALRLGEGIVVIAPAPREDQPPAFEERRYSERYSCPYDGFTIDELEPRSFSFNSPHGACPDCTGLGTRLEIDPDLVVPDRTLSVAGGALLRPWARMPMADSWFGKVAEAVCRCPRLGSRRADQEAPARKRLTTCSTRRRASRSSSAIATSAARTPTRRASRGSSRTSPGATARPTRSTSRPSSSGSWSAGPARPAAASG